MHPNILLQLLWLAGSPSVGCTEPPRIASGVLAYHGPVTERSDYDLSQIRELANRSNRPLQHAPLGFYIGSLSQDIIVGTERQASPDGSRCDYLTTVTVQLSLVDRVIQMATDLDGNGCELPAVLKHYQKHAAADDRVLSQYVQAVDKGLKDAWPLMAAKLSPPGHPDEDGIRQVVQNVLNRVFKDYKAVRAEANAAVDGTAEVATLVCGSKT